MAPAAIAPAEQQTMAERLAMAVRIPTVSLSPLKPDVASLAHSRQGLPGAACLSAERFPAFMPRCSAKRIEDPAVPGAALYMEGSDRNTAAVSAGRASGRGSRRARHRGTLAASTFSGDWPTALCGVVISRRQVQPDRHPRSHGAPDQGRATCRSGRLSRLRAR